MISYKNHKQGRAALRLYPDRNFFVPLLLSTCCISGFVLATAMFPVCCHCCTNTPISTSLSQFTIPSWEEAIKTLLLPVHMPFFPFFFLSNMHLVPRGFLVCRRRSLSEKGLLSWRRHALQPAAQGKPTPENPAFMRRVNYLSTDDASSQCKM